MDDKRHIYFFFFFFQPEYQSQVEKKKNKKKLFLPIKQVNRNIPNETYLDEFYQNSKGSNTKPNLPCIYGTYGGLQGYGRYRKRIEKLN